MDLALRADSQSERDPLVGGRYRVVREIGRGAMGVVYEVEHVHTGERLALKHGLVDERHDPQFLERFRREARTWARIAHEHVVRIVDADTSSTDDAPYLVMELLKGFSLEELVAKRGRVPAAVVLELLLQIASALDHAHAVGIVHRDLKPENVFVHFAGDGKATVKILDWGIAKSLDDETTDITATGMIVGTPSYMAPEQAVGKLDAIGRASDIWAVGMIATYLVTGDDYWQAENTGLLLLKVGRGATSKPSLRWKWLTSAFDEWFARSCMFEPSKRWPSVGEQVEGLCEALGASREASPADAPHEWLAAGRPRPSGARLKARPLAATLPASEPRVHRTRDDLPKVGQPRRTATVAEVPEPARTPSVPAMALGLSVVAIIIATWSTLSLRPAVSVLPTSLHASNAPTSVPSPSGEATPTSSTPEVSRAPDAVGPVDEASVQQLVRAAQAELDHGGPEGHEKARELAARAVAATPSNAEAWLTLGAAFEALQDHRSAVAAYRSCVESASGRRVRECRALAR
jgi:serine/threonine-protein kinase